MDGKQLLYYIVMAVLIGVLIGSVVGQILGKHISKVVTVEKLPKLNVVSVSSDLSKRLDEVSSWSNRTKEELVEIATNLFLNEMERNKEESDF